jgi:hypothetical protein
VLVPLKCLLMRNHTTHGGGTSGGTHGGIERSEFLLHAAGTMPVLCARSKTVSRQYPISVSDPAATNGFLQATLVACACMWFRLKTSSLETQDPVLGAGRRG